MTQWWKVASHLDEALLASVNAMLQTAGSAPDDPTLVFAFQDKLREAQVILLAIFESKGLVSSSTVTQPPIAAPPSPPPPIAVPPPPTVREAVSAALASVMPPATVEEPSSNTPPVVQVEEGAAESNGLFVGEGKGASNGQDAHHNEEPVVAEIVTASVVGTAPPTETDASAPEATVNQPSSTEAPNSNGTPPELTEPFA